MPATGPQSLLSSFKYSNKFISERDSGSSSKTIGEIRCSKM